MSHEALPLPCGCSVSICFTLAGEKRKGGFIAGWFTVNLVWVSVSEVWASAQPLQALRHPRVYTLT